MSTCIDEETPLIPPRSVQATPFPWFQFIVITSLRLVEPLHSHVIQPFLPQFIRDIGVTHGNESRVGYYVGILPSLFFLSQALSSPTLSIMSDKVGRRPMTLICFLAGSISMLCFGMSKTFGGLVLSWIVNGAANGSIVLFQIMTIEITDATSIAKACAYLPIAWHIGATAGPLLGGSLSRPAERFPGLFGSSVFLQEYPYFLPCAAAAAISTALGIIAYAHVQETVKKPVPFSALFGFQDPDKTTSSTDTTLEQEAIPYDDQPLPFRALLTLPVLLVAGSYALISFLTAAYSGIRPLFLSTPIELGGLGLAPSAIGPILSANEVISAVLQVAFFPKMYDHWGPNVIFVAGVASMLPGFLCFPIMSNLAKSSGLSTTVWAVVAFQTMITTGLTFSYCTILIFIAAASPNKASIGATTGVCQVAVSILRAVGPALANSLFSLTLANGYLGGYLVYFVLTVLAGISIMIALLLPRTIHGTK